MKLIDLLERAKQTTLMYHGTSDVFLKDILKKGLMANPPTRVYGGDDDDPGPAGYETLGGVYMSGDDSVAYRAARDAADKFGGSPMTITIQYGIGTGTLDEDHVTGIMLMLINQEIEQFYDAQENDDELAEYPDFTSWEVQHRDEIISELVKYTKIKLGGFGKVKQNTEQLLVKAYNHIFDNVEEDSLYTGNGMAELQHDDYFIKLLMALMRGVNDDPTRVKNVQVTRDIGYRGKTKIVQIETENGIVYQHQGQHVTF